MWRLHAAGRLEGPQQALFQPRPAEELYDTELDPHEIRNLAADPAHAPELERLRAALDAWRAEVGDLGEMPETEMVRQWYPGDQQPVTATPVPIPICESSPGVEPAPHGGTFKGPVLLQYYCATQGASIGYAFGAGAPRWQLYTAPLRLPAGTTTVLAKAIRIGYKESSERTATFQVTP